MEKYIIKNGTIVDGMKTPRYIADILIVDDKIQKIAPSIKEEGRVIDATGLIVAPGFIDGHTHSDGSIAGGSDSYNHLEQGTTTQIAGQCGSSPAPHDLGQEEPQKHITLNDLKTPQAFMKYAQTMEIGCNMAFFIGHGALRGNAMGYSDAKPTEAQMTQMKNMLQDAMESGYLGMSSGLVYAPSVYGDQTELTALCRHMAPFGGRYTTHMRGEGDRVVDSVKEAIETAEKGGVPLIISHLKVCGQKNRGTSKTLLSMIEAASARGMTIYADQYPFTAGSAPLSAQTPAKYIVGGIPELLKRLQNPQIRAQIEHSIFNETDEFESLIYSAGWQGTLVAGAEKTPHLVGKRITEIAAETGVSPMDAYADLLIKNNGRAQGIYFSAVEEDMLNILAHPLITAGSDWSDYSTRHDSEKTAGAHPRGTGTMTRRIELCRDLHLRTLEDSIHSITGLTAASVGIKNRGILKEGAFADITIFDYNTIKCNADYIHPFRRNDGIQTVFVNGEIAVEKGKTTGLRRGRIILRGE